MNKRRQIALIVFLVVFIVGIILGRATLFTVNERELAVVLQFGNPVASYDSPGLKWKIPFIQEVRRLPKTLQFWAGTGANVLVDLPTKDGKKIEVTPWAIWRITDPRRFVEVLRTIENAEIRVAQFVRGEMRDAVTANDLVEVVRSNPRTLSYTIQVEEPIKPDQNDSDAPDSEPAGVEIPAVKQPGADQHVRKGREKIVEEIKKTVLKRLSESRGEGEAGRGIELVDVGIARIDFVPAVQQAAFDRLIAFMESIASRYTNEGQRRKQEILNQTEAEVQRILGEGKRQANETRGSVEAEMIKDYAEAIKETGEFYNFIRTLDMYKLAMDSKTRLVLTTDSDLFGLLKTVSPAEEIIPPGDAGAETEAVPESLTPVE